MSVICEADASNDPHRDHDDWAYTRSVAGECLTHVGHV